jgi:dihydropteroate synthase
MDKLLKCKGGTVDFTHGCVVMGILNVTPDSFSDGGKFSDTDTAVAHAIKMLDAGASIIDIGPESTRPGAEPVATEQQIARSVGVIEKLCSQRQAVVSIDTCNHEVAEAAIKAGASIINDVTALSDPDMAELAAVAGVPVVLMHMQGTPGTMQQKPQYDDVVAEVLNYLLDKAKYAEEMGVDRDKIIIDPGIGFGKTLEHNLELMRNLDKFVETGYRVLLGTSRKQFIGELTGREIALERAFGTAATVALAVEAGVSIVRVHDVDEMGDVVKVANAITG